MAGSLGTTRPRCSRWLVYVTTPDGNGGGIWSSGGGLGADSSGNIYFNTGNGDFNVNTGGRDYGDSVVKLSPSGTVVDYFTPFDEANMEQNDLDLSSAGPVLLLDQPGSFPHELITAAKTGTIYVSIATTWGTSTRATTVRSSSLSQVFCPNGTIEVRQLQRSGLL